MVAHDAAAGVTGEGAGPPVRRAPARTYQVRTYGCQMNVHDSERLAGLLEAAGYRRATDGSEADVVVFNTCAVRENADNRLYGNLSHLAPRKRANPDMQIAVGGCLAQKDRDAVLRRAPWVDVVFGTHNIGSLPTLLERARHNKVAQVEIAEALQQFPSSLPSSRESAYAAWVSISVGCNNSCTFCIVPSLRGREVDRSPADILAEVRSLVNDGVLEVTLLGQNVNAYGVSFADPALPRNRGAFAELLRACGDIDGLERVRFTSPHPAEFTDHERLIALQEQISLEANRALVGQAVEVLVATGEGRKDTVTARMSGRARDGRLVHFTAGQPRVRPGDVITTKVTEAAPHHLIADAGVLTHRRTRAGDAHTAGQPGRAVGLGMPGVGLPVSAAKPGGCR